MSAELTGGTAIKLREFLAFGDRIFVRPTKNARVTDGGIALPDTVQEQPTEGEIVAVGDEVSNGVRIGMEVIFSGLSGLETQIDENHYIVIREKDILAVRV